MGDLSQLFASKSNPYCHQRLGFVHIPKTGGTTVILAMREDHCAMKSLHSLVMWPRSNLFHETARMQRERSSADWDSAYTFGIVRNPFDWAVSQFFYNMRDRCTWVRKPACKYADLVYRDGNTTNYVYNESHREYFTTWLKEHDEIASRTGQQFMEPNMISRNLSTSTSQLAWLTDSDGRSLVRHVVRLEDEQDYDRHATCEGLRAIMCDRPAPPTAKGAEHVKTSGHVRSSAYYTALGCDIVRRRFAVDFAAFGYDRDACLYQ